MPKWKNFSVALRFIKILAASWSRAKYFVAKVGARDVGIEYSCQVNHFLINLSTNFSGTQFLNIFCKYPDSIFVELCGWLCNAMPFTGNAFDMKIRVLLQSQQYNSIILVESWIKLRNANAERWVVFMFVKLLVKF